MDGEKLAEHTEKYLKIQESVPLEEGVEIDSRFISDELLVFTADWYRKRYPGFPDHYYDVFENFSTQIKCDDKADVDTKL
jgi:hypothetical protein